MLMLNSTHRKSLAEISFAVFKPKFSTPLLFKKKNSLTLKAFLGKKKNSEPLVPTDTAQLMHQLPAHVYT